MLLLGPSSRLLFFFFNDTATTEIYTLSLHDALPIYLQGDVVRYKKYFYVLRPLLAARWIREGRGAPPMRFAQLAASKGDRKSTRLNSSHQIISYAVFCLKKKNDAFASDAIASSSCGR